MSMAFTSNLNMPWPLPAAATVLKKIVCLPNLLLLAAVLKGMVTLRNVVLFVLSVQICLAVAEPTIAAGGFVTPSVEVATAKPFLTLNTTQFGPRIEAASVDKFGNIFATDFVGGGQSSRSALGQIANASSKIAQKEFFEDAIATFNGLRFLPSARASRRALAADTTNNRVLQIEQSTASAQPTSRVFCTDPSMVEPNDLTVAYKAGRIYISGQNYTATTLVGDGNLWMCPAPASFFNAQGSRITKPVKAVRLGVFGRTNGIEVSPDEKTLYLSEAFNKDWAVVSNKIWQFTIDPKSGLVSNKKLFVDFQQLDGSGAVDADGMRTDVHGNLFITRNGNGQVLKFSPQGKLLLRINLTSIVAATNLEFGGPFGKSLVIVGQCNDGSPFGEGKGCADVWRGNRAPGHAFHTLKYIPLSY
ncbi:hypothetical protein Mapa_009809 [Marchantia paleacea]|nr:hypothetical protein Mapa_009809 [Marchantia paleacea]